jgi:hypothetical protein
VFRSSPLARQRQFFCVSLFFLVVSHSVIFLPRFFSSSSLLLFLLFLFLIASLSRYPDGDNDIWENLERLEGRPTTAIQGSPSSYCLCCALKWKTENRTRKKHTSYIHTRRALLSLLLSLLFVGGLDRANDARTASRILTGLPGWNRRVIAHNIQNARESRDRDNCCRTWHS